MMFTSEHAQRSPGPGPKSKPRSWPRTDYRSYPMSSMGHLTNERSANVMEETVSPKFTWNFCLGCKNILQSSRGASSHWALYKILVTCVCLLSLWLIPGVRMLASTNTDTVVTLAGSEADTMHASGNLFGSTQTSVLENLIQLTKLNTAYLPENDGKAPEERSRRLIFVGDIHGSFDELMHLLAVSEYDEALDHVITTGDMVNKGPDSGKVIDFLISKGASCVRGNHDDKILLKVAQASTAQSQQAGADDPELRLAMTLSEAQLLYLSSCPIILSVGMVPHHGNVVVVHGGLVPSLGLAEQDPWAVMNMRVIHSSSHLPSKDRERTGYVPWTDLWNLHQLRHLPGDFVPVTGEKQLHSDFLSTTVVYGHDARRGLQIHKYTKGLDSGCVRGRKLTALVLSHRPGEEIFQVQCKQYA